MPRLPEILIVDDRAENLFALEHLLKGLDCAVCKASSGDEALALTLEHDFALAIVDVQMPGMDGYELVEFLRADPATSQVPVIFVSAAYADEHHQFRGYESGAVDYIVKPFEPAVLLGKVRVFLELAHYRANLESIIEDRTSTILKTSQIQLMVVDLSSTFLNLPLRADFDREVDRALGRAALGLGADRAYIFQLRDDKLRMDNTHEWCAQGIDPMRDMLQDLPLEAFEWTWRQFESSNTIVIPSVRDMPDEAAAERESMLAHGIESLVLVGLRFGRSLRGFIGLDTVREKRVWSDSESELLLMLGNILMGAIKRQATVNALRESEERFRAVATMNWVWETDAEGRFTYSSDKVSDLLGYSVAEVIGRQALDLVEGADAARLYESLSRLSTQGRPLIDFGCRKLAKDGRTVHTQTSCVPIRDGMGNLVGYRGTDRDVTERHAAEHALRQFKTIFDTANFGAAIADLDGVLTYVNDCFAASHGYAADDLVGRHLGSLHDAEQMDQVRRLLGEARRDGGFEAQEVGHRRRDGSPFPMLMVGSLVRDAEGSPFCVAMTAIDLTDRKILQEQLQHAQRLESVGRLAGGVAHDFNNMLGVILGLVEIASLRLQRGQSIDSCLDEITKAAERSVGLTRQLLAFARKQTVTPEVLDLNEVVGNMLKLLKRLIGENINLNWIPAEDVWLVRLDPAQLDQILANLCVNARDAIDDVGEVTITTTNFRVDESFRVGHPSRAPGDYVALSVSDTGHGMDRETLSHIFEPFFTTKEPGRGTGLGLSTVYGAVKQNHGFIDVSSVPGQGTTYTILFPRHEGPLVSMSRDEGPTSSPRGHETILVAEDEISYLKTTTMKLEELGYAVLPANSPREALRIAEEYDGVIHLLLTDVVMPDINGKELAGMLTARFPNLKVVYMSGYPNDIIAQHGVLESGAILIEKPSSTLALSARIRQALGYQSSGNAVPDATADVEIDLPVSDEALVRFPAPLSQAMRCAVADGDMVRLRQLIEKTRDIDISLARRLHTLAGRYDYQKLEELLAKAEAMHE